MVYKTRKYHLCPLLLLIIFSNTTSAVAQISYLPSFVDDFTHGLDSSIWNTIHHESPDYKYIEYDGETESVYVRNGYLHLKSVKKDNCVIQPMVHTRDKMLFRYGKIEIRAKIPVGLGVWPAIWMVMPEEYPDNHGEIDILEYIESFKRKSYQSALHFYFYNHGKYQEQQNTKMIGFNYKKFHVFGLEWYPDRIIFYLDHKIVYTYRKEQRNVWPFDYEYFLKLNVDFGRGWGASAGVDENILPKEMLVDWIKYYPLIEN